MDALYKKLLERQQYRFVGEHSAVKVCGWTKTAVKGKGGCYKQKFYGIQSHQCAQMSPAVNFCNHDCVFCWRERNNSSFGKIDDPVEVANGVAEAQVKLLAGFGGHPNADLQKFAESRQIKHVAISLNGETFAYPKIGELITEFHKMGQSTFVVSNGTFPERLKEMITKNQLPTQLYISLEAPNKGIYIKVDRPIFENTWDKLMETLDVLHEIKDKTRTVIRVTLVKDVNMVDPEGYAKLIEKAQPKFLEVKGYMFVGASRMRLNISNMPRHPEVKSFAEEIGKHCGYKVIDESEISRVVLMMEEDSPDRIMKFD